MRTLKEDFFDNIGIGERTSVEQFCNNFNIPISWIDDDLNIDSKSIMQLYINDKTIKYIPTNHEVNIKNWLYHIEISNIDFLKTPVELFNDSKLSLITLYNCKNCNEFFKQNNISVIHSLDIDCEYDEIDYKLIPNCFNCHIFNGSYSEESILNYKKLNIKNDLILPLQFFHSQLKKQGSYLITKNKQFFEKFNRWISKLGPKQVLLKEPGKTWTTDKIKYNK